MISYGCSLSFAGVSHLQQIRPSCLWPSRISNNQGTTGGRTWCNELGKGLLYLFFVAFFLHNKKMLLVSLVGREEFVSSRDRTLDLLQGCLFCCLICLSYRNSLSLLAINYFYTGRLWRKKDYLSLITMTHFCHSSRR